MAEVANGNGPLPHDIMGLQPRPLSWMPVLVIVAAVLVCGLLAWWLWRQRKRNQAEAAVESKAQLARPVDPWVRLDQALRQIDVRDPWTRETCEELFFQLSFLLREALELRTGLPITGQTLAETRQSLGKTSALSANFQQELLKFLSLAEQLKFAGQWISDGESKEWRDKVKTWLDELRHGVQA